MAAISGYRNLVIIQEGESIDNPKVTLSLQLKETWPSFRKINSNISVDWQADDASIIRISEGKIYGLKYGTTTVSAQSNGMTVSADIQVNHVKGSEVKENIVVQKCETPGSYDAVIYCTKCKEEVSRTKKITAETKGHSFDAGKITENATCSVTGTKEFTCTECGEIKTEEIKKLTVRSPSIVQEVDVQLENL